jgi:type I restriction enzyme M protein
MTAKRTSASTGARGAAQLRVPVKSAITNHVADKSLESWIWDAACSIRGAQEAPKFKDFILPLIFTKRLCDVFDDELDRIAQEVGSRSKAFKLVEKDHKLVRFYLPIKPNDPSEPVWSVIRKLASKIGESLTMYLHDIAKANPALEGIIDRMDFNATTHGQRDIDDDRLSDLIERISEKRLGLKDVEADIIGRSYEYLIRKFAEGSGQSAGEFFTPPEVARIMALIMDPEPGMSVYDPCCGSAGLLIACEHVLDEKMKLSGKTKYAPLRMHGQEYVATTWAMANMNMTIHDMEGSIEIGDTFKNPKFRVGNRLQKFERVVSNPMWNQDAFTEEDYDADQFSRFGFGVAPESTADWGWMQHMLTSTVSAGRLAVVLDTPAVSRGSGSKNKSRERDIRKAFIDRGLIETVILLPENLFYNTGAPGIIMIVDTRRRTGAPVRLINASQLFHKGQPKNFLAEEHIERIVAAAASKEDIDDLCRLVPAEAIADLDYDLSPSRHVPLDPQVPVMPLCEALDTHKGASAQVEQATSKRARIFERIMDRPAGAPAVSGWVRTSFESVISKKISGDWGEGAPVDGADYVRCLVVRGTDFPEVAQLRVAEVPVRFIRRDVFEKKRPQKGDVLVEISGGGKYQNTGRALYVGEELLSVADRTIFHTNFTKLLRVNEAKVLAKYFFYYWTMLYEMGRTARYEKQPTSIKNFKLGDFLAHEFIAYPHQKAQQAAIVKTLDALHDELQAIDAAQKVLLAIRHAALKELLGGIRRVPVSEGLPTRHPR